MLWIAQHGLVGLIPLLHLCPPLAISLTLWKTVRSATLKSAIFSSDANVEKVFRDLPRLCYRRAPNLRDHVPNPCTICHLSLRMPEGNFKRFSCVVCNDVLTERDFVHPHMNKLLKVRGRITCLSIFLVHLLLCLCGLLYVGKTNRHFKTRICKCKCGNRNELSPVARHYNTAGLDCNWNGLWV